MNITNTQLNEVCNDVLIKANQTSPFYYAYFQFLYVTGSRPADALNPDYLLSNNGTSCIFQPSKNNAVRIIPTSLVNNIMLTFYTNKEKHFTKGSYRRMLRFYNSVLNSQQFDVSDRHLNLYVFRYNYVRRLAQNGFEVAQIKSLMGWRTTAIVESYINRAITSR